jgi:ribosomal protein S12 methylthiotransferase accessory factor
VRDLRNRHPKIEVRSATDLFGDLRGRFTAADVEVHIIDITSDIGIPSVLAVSWDRNESSWDGTRASTSAVHTGVGTHPDLDVALTRALTECAQSRAVDIQAVREDISLPGADVPTFHLFTRRVAAVDKSGWPWSGSADATVRSDALPSYSSGDVMADVRLMLERLRSCGLSRVLVVDLSPPGLPVSVVRVIVPGLESWGTDRSKLGRRAADAWNREVHAVYAGDPVHENAAAAAWAPA